MDPENDVVEVFVTRDRMAAETVADEILAGQGIDAVIHDRVSHMIPAPASMDGGYFVAVPSTQVQRAVETLQEALAGGIVDGELTAGIA
jgi:hypothetical protein